MSPQEGMTPEQATAAIEAVTKQPQKAKKPKRVSAVVLSARGRYIKAQHPAGSPAMPDPEYADEATWAAFAAEYDLWWDEHKHEHLPADDGHAAKTRQNDAVMPEVDTSTASSNGIPEPKKPRTRSAPEPEDEDDGPEPINVATLSYEEMRDLLEDLDCEPRGSTVRCPTAEHTDNIPSAFIKEGDDEDGLPYVVGCSVCGSGADYFRRVAAFIRAGVPKDEPEYRWSSKSRSYVSKYGKTVSVREATYDYTHIDERGIRVIVVKYKDRIVDEDEQPTDKKKFSWHPPGAKQPLYKVDEVKKATWVIPVEGEKDADNLNASGLLDKDEFATTLPNGGGSGITDEVLAPLVDKVRDIITDNDEVGRRWPIKVIERLRALGHKDEIGVYVCTKGKDVSDHLAAGGNLHVGDPDGLVAAYPKAEKKRSRLIIHRASEIKKRRTHWVWGPNRLAESALAILAGQPGVGKSTLAIWVAAMVTRGRLPGEYKGKPRYVVVVSTEDAWEEVIVPKLDAADADMDKVLFIEGVTEGDDKVMLTLPKHVEDLAALMDEYDVGLLLLDPLISRLGSHLDSHKDAEVRQALEPLVGIIERHHTAALGVMHINKGGSSGHILDRIMASKAFVAVARIVQVVVRDQESETPQFLFGVVKNNLGPDDSDSQAFVVEQVGFIDDEDGSLGETSRICWTAADSRSVGTAMSQADHDQEQVSAVKDCAEWLSDLLGEFDGQMDRTTVDEMTKTSGYNPRMVDRARKRAGIKSMRKRTEHGPSVWFDPARWWNDNGVLQPVVTPEEEKW